MMKKPASILIAVLILLCTVAAPAFASNATAVSTSETDTSYQASSAAWVVDQDGNIVRSLEVGKTYTVIADVQIEQPVNRTRIRLPENWLDSGRRLNAKHAELFYVTCSLDDAVIQPKCSVSNLNNEAIQITYAYGSTRYTVNEEFNAVQYCVDDEDAFIHGFKPHEPLIASDELKVMFDIHVTRAPQQTQTTTSSGLARKSPAEPDFIKKPEPPEASQESVDAPEVERESVDYTKMSTGAKSPDEEDISETLTAMQGRLLRLESEVDELDNNQYAIFFGLVGTMFIMSVAVAAIVSQKIEEKYWSLRRAIANAKANASDSDGENPDGEPPEADNPNNPSLDEDVAGKAVQDDQTDGKDVIAPNGGAPAQGEEGSDEDKQIDVTQITNPDVHGDIAVKSDDAPTDGQTDLTPEEIVQTCERLADDLNK